MNKFKSFFPIFIPGATVFISSGCIMILELVAGRLIARHLGSSLYTWTSVIGVVLAGITIGNYLGGRIADRFTARKSLAVLFGAASAACVATVILNNLVGGWMLLLHFNWPARVFSHVALVFLIPSTLLGMISPVIAKMALDRGLPTGRTVGDIYAWGAAGSITGTFLAGFYLIAAMGTIAIIWTVGAVLLLLAILYWARLWVLYIWAAIFVALMAMGVAPVDWAKNVGSGLALRENPKSDIIYEDESQYSYIAVKQAPENPNKRIFLEDKLTHSEIIMGNITDLQSPYEQIYAAVTHKLSRNKIKLSILSIGGGGYIIPRYVENVWPGSRIDVAEIDSSVTEAAIKAFGLEKATTINTYTVDARNYIDNLLDKERNGQEICKYDFVYEDAFNDCSVPYQLVTVEFNDKIYKILTEDGVYMINMIDIYDSGQFLGAVINTLEKTFPYVYAVAKLMPRTDGSNFIVIGAKQKINLEGLGTENPVKNLRLWVLSNSEMKTLKEKNHGIVLTDNYVPVENLLTPVADKRAKFLLATEYFEQAAKLTEQGKFDESISRYRDIINIYPELSIEAYFRMGGVRSRQEKWNEAADALNNAIEYNEKAQVKQSTSIIHLYLGLMLKKLGRNKEAEEYLHKAIQEYRAELAEKPYSAKIAFQLGNALAEVGEIEEAIKYFRQATDMAPADVENHLNLATALLVLKHYDEAIEQLNKGIQFMQEQSRKDDAIRLQRLLESVELKKSNKK